MSNFFPLQLTFCNDTKWNLRKEHIFVEAIHGSKDRRNTVNKIFVVSVEKQRHQHEGSFPPTFPMVYCHSRQGDLSMVAALKHAPKIQPWMRHPCAPASLNQIGMRTHTLKCSAKFHVAAKSAQASILEPFHLPEASWPVEGNILGCCSETLSKHWIQTSNIWKLEHLLKYWKVWTVFNKQKFGKVFKCPVTCKSICTVYVWSLNRQRLLSHLCKSLSEFPGCAPSAPREANAVKASSKCRGLCKLNERGQLPLLHLSSPYQSYRPLCWRSGTLDSLLGVDVSCAGFPYRTRDIWKLVEIVILRWYFQLIPLVPKTGVLF